MNNHLILTKIIDRTIHNLKGGIIGSKYCIENNMNKEYHTKRLEEQKEELEILEKQRRIIFDNYLLFDVN